ncbi:DUF1365 domain-containing protein [Roseateles chitosanitabidus]|uniref:DUF1365 domain-containing protein n=1 Tax=Roseateles chitosanitabidus TaxID=65048 RepID=UPI000834FB6C|nr:DUF1365 family protein [Roseateles chitosanitabidus]
MSGGPDFRSALYRGRVMHQRLKPLRHRLSYRVFSMLIDIDELAALDARLRWFSVGRFNLFSFRPTDHGDGQATDGPGLRAHLEARLREAGLRGGGAIRLLTLPRLLGYAFNPLSVWFCDAPEGGLQAIVYEVNNTFGQRHSYLIPVDDAARDDGPIAQRCDKRLYVSPFLGMDLHYRFRVERPREALSLGISVHEGAAAPGIGHGGLPLDAARHRVADADAGRRSDPDARDAAGAAVLNARLDATRGALTDAALLRLLVAYPLLTLKVIVGIHWEALRLWIKGARLQPRPDAPRQPMTVVRPADPT